MKIFKKLKLVCCILLTMLFIITCGVSASASVLGEKYSDDVFIYDEAGMFTSDTVNDLNHISKDVKDRYECNIVAVTIDSLGGRTIEEVANEESSYLTDKSVLFLISKEDRRMRIRVGEELRELFDDDCCKFEVEYMGIYFKRGDYDAGLRHSYRAFVTRISNYYYSNPLSKSENFNSTEKSSKPSGRSGVIGILVFFGILILIGGLLSKKLGIKGYNIDEGCGRGNNYYRPRYRGDGYYERRRKRKQMDNMENYLKHIDHRQRRRYNSCDSSGFLDDCDSSGYADSYNDDSSNGGGASGGW